jgi:adenylate cyclase
MGNFTAALKKNSHFYLISLLSLAVFVLLQFFDPPLVRDLLESKTYDLRLHLRNLVQKPPRSNDIAIVMVDEQSIAEIGRWPWSREVQARLVEKIASGRPKVIGIDIMFSERENAVADGKLARALREAGNVVLATAFLTEKGERKEGGQAPPPDFLWDAAFMEVKSVPGIEWKRWALKPEKVNPPIEELARVASLGHVTNIPDLDGVLRWDFMYVSYGDDCYPSLPLQVARIASGTPMKEMILFGGSKVKIGDRLIGTDLSGRVLVNYLGPEKSFRHISAADLLNGKVSPEVLHDRIVLLGTSALGTHDQKVTPFSANYPGVEKNANVVNNILSNNFIRKSPGIFEMVAILVTSLILIVFLPRLKATPGVVLAFALMGSYFLVSCYLLIRYNVWLNLLAPSANMTVITATGTITRLFMEEKRAREIRAMFSSYVTERLVDEMIRNPEMARLGGEKREVTVLFSDVKGFTNYSENHSPEEVVSILNEYLGEMTAIVLRWEGLLDKFIGDAIVVFWGAPMRQDDHAERAVRCALDMQERLGELRRKWEAEGKAPLDSGIGLNTGEAIVGNIGAEGKKMDYTVIGDHVNLGARVEGLTRRYDTSILMTEYTLEKLRPALASATLTGVSICGLERVIVKGKDTPVGIYAVTPLDPQAAPVCIECDPAKVVRLTEK